MANHIIFDLDGTLIDSKKEIAATYGLVFNRIPPLVPVDPISLNFGATLQQVLSNVYHAEPEKIGEAKRLFASVYDTSEYEDTSIYNGVTETLEALQKNGYIMHIATNKRYTPTCRILEAKNMRSFFSEIMANDVRPSVTLTKRDMIANIKSSANFSSGFMVGDSETDIEAGNQEGLATVAVTYGYDSVEKLKNKNPAGIIDSFYNLYTFVTEHSPK